MNLKKYMSKHFLVRICLLFALVGAAAVFDMYHTANQKLADSIKKIPGSEETETNKVFICNQIPTYNLKTAGTDFSVRLRFTCTQNKFLQKHYNLRTFQLMKAETTHSCFPSVSALRSLPFNRVLYDSPDDTPPLS